jgi:hypothetical protein
MSETQTQQWMQENLEKLKSLRDQLRVDLHLAGMDAKDKLKEMEPLVKKAEHLVNDVSDTSRKAMAEIVQKVEAFAQALKGSRPSGPRAKV